MTRQPTRAAIDTEDGWLALLRAGMPIAMIATEAAVTSLKVRQGLCASRAREAESGSRPKPPPRRPTLELTVAYGSSCKPLTLLTCDDVHPHGPIPKGSAICCACCHATGLEGHPDLAIDPDEMPAPEPKKPRNKLNRKAKRAAKARGAA